MLNELYFVAFRKKIYRTLKELQTGLDKWLQERVHEGRWCYGKARKQTCIDSVPLAKEKMLA